MPSHYKGKKAPLKIVPPCGPTCASCPLGGASGPVPGTGFFTPDGAMTSGVMIVGESLGEADAEQFKALVGSAGFLMGRAFSRKGWNRDTFRYAQVLSCHPTEPIRNKRKWLLPWATEAAQTCLPNLQAQIDQWQPKCIVALGQFAFERLTGVQLPLMSARGYVFHTRDGKIPVITTFHPEFLMKGQQALTQVFVWDIEKSIRVARDGYTYDTIDCLMNPSVSVWNAYVEDYVRDPTRPLSLDIETNYKRKHADDEDEVDITEDDDPSFTINTISFAFEHHRGASVDWSAQYLPGIQRLIEAAIKHSFIEGWNLHGYDRPRIAYNLQMELPIEKCLDTMNSWHVCFNSLPRKLGFATSCLPRSFGIKCWKHLNHTEPGYYSTVDSVALWRNSRDCEDILRSTGAEGVYDLICKRLDPVLEHMTLKGMPINPEKRAKLRAELQVRMEALQQTMDAIVPEAVKSPKVWKSHEGAVKGKQTLIDRMQREEDTNWRLIEGAELYKIEATQKVTSCGACGAWPVSKSSHTSKKTVKEAVHG